MGKKLEYFKFEVYATNAKDRIASLTKALFFSKGDFVPAVSIDKDYHTENDKKEMGYEIKDTEKSITLSPDLDERNPQFYIVEIDRKKVKKELQLRFYVKKGKEEAKDLRGIIEAKGIGVEIAGKAKMELDYGWKFDLKISTDNIKKDARIEFYAEDDDKDTSGDKILCGAVYFGYKQTCFCDRDFTVEEMTDIVTQLRKLDDVKMVPQLNERGLIYLDKSGNQIQQPNGKKPPEAVEIYRLEKNAFDEEGIKIFNWGAEKMQRQDATIEIFTKELNSLFKEYEIKTCIRKIHFLAQAYHETQRFHITYEASPANTPHGGMFYRGRGLLHLTHSYNFYNAKAHMQDKSAPIDSKKIDKILAENPNTKKKLDEFVLKTTKEMHDAAYSSGAYWRMYNINNYADDDNVKKVSAVINTGNATKTNINGLSKRKEYYEKLKKIFEYEKCINKK